MTLEPLLQAPLAVKLHVAFVIPAFPVGTWVIFFGRKGTPAHRALGVLFIALMVAAAVSALFIHRRMPNSPVFGLSPIHLYVPFVLGLIVWALIAIRRGQIRLHQQLMRGLYMGALVFNGLSNAFLLDGITHDVVFKPTVEHVALAATPVLDRAPRLQIKGLVEP